MKSYLLTIFTSCFVATGLNLPLAARTNFNPIFTYDRLQSSTTLLTDLDQNINSNSQSNQAYDNRISLYSKPAFYDEQINIAFSESIGQLELRGKKIFSDPGLGYSVRYEDRKNSAKLDIYIYDDNLSNIASGVQSKQVQYEFIRAIQVIEYFAAMRIYRKLSEIYRGKRIFCGVEFLSAVHQYEKAQNQGYMETKLSETFITGYKDKFIKVRFTYKKNDKEKWSQTNQKSFMNEFCKALR